jgi:hypothetical protein
MVAWALTFLVVGLVAAPVLVRAAGIKVRCMRTCGSAVQDMVLSNPGLIADHACDPQNLAALSATDKSYLVLANQVCFDHFACTALALLSMVRLLT